MSEPIFDNSMNLDSRGNSIIYQFSDQMKIILRNAVGEKNRKFISSVSKLFPFTANLLNNYWWIVIFVVVVVCIMKGKVCTHLVAWRCVTHNWGQVWFELNISWIIFHYPHFNKFESDLTVSLLKVIKRLTIIWS